MGVKAESVSGSYCYTSPRHFALSHTAQSPLNTVHCAVLQSECQISFKSMLSKNSNGSSDKFVAVVVVVVVFFFCELH